jgi:hypothetical protein
MTKACPRPQRRSLAIGKPTRPERVPKSTTSAEPAAGHADASGLREHEDDTAEASRTTDGRLERWDDEEGGASRRAAR